MAINDILGELGNGVDGSLFADVLAIYISIRNQRVTTRALLTTTNKIDLWGAERGLSFPLSETVLMIFRKRKKKRRETIRDNTKKPNYTIQRKHPVTGNYPEQQIKQR